MAELSVLVSFFHFLLLRRLLVSFFHLLLRRLLVSFFHLLLRRLLVLFFRLRLRRLLLSFSLFISLSFFAVVLIWFMWERGASCCVGMGCFVFK